MNRLPRLRRQHHDERRRTERHHADRGAALIFAVGFVVMIGAITAGMSSLVVSNSNHGSALAILRNRQYAAEAAIEDAITAVRNLDRTGTGACSVSGGATTSTLNGVTIRVDWRNACTTVKGADGMIVGQRDVIFTACVSAANACTASTVLVSAQVNFEQGTTGAVTRTYVQSWSVTS